jgi:hypothetical protein
MTGFGISSEQTIHPNNIKPIEWLSFEDLSKVTGWSMSKILTLKHRGKFTLIKYEKKARCRGGKRPLVHINDPEIPEEARERYYRQDNGGIIPFNQEQKMQELNQSNPPIHLHPEEINDTKTQRNLAIIREARNIPPGMKTDDWYGVVAKQYGVSKATVYRKISESGARASIRVTDTTQDSYIPIKSRSFSEEAVSWAVGQYLATPRILVKDLYAKMTRLAPEKGWQLGSIKALYRIIESIPAPMEAFSIGGRRAVEHSYMPKIRRDLSAYHVMECLVGDQHIFDYVVLDDDGNPFSPQMYAWLDQRSRYWAGVFPSFGSYSSIDIGLSLKDACKFGIPKKLYTDNGKPELSNYVTGLRGQLSGLSINVDSNDGYIQHTKARPRTPRAKIIESHFWHGMESLLLRKGLPGYRKRAINEFENEQRLQDISQMKKEGKLLNYREFWQEVLKTIQEANQRTLTTENIIPEVYFFEHLPEAPLLRFDDQTLDFIFLPSCRRRVRESMIQITLPGYGKCFYYGRELAPYTGKEVEIRYNPYDNERVYALDPQTHQLLSMPKLEKEINPKDQEQVREKIRRYASLASFWVDQTKKYITKAQRNYPIQFSPYTQGAAQAKADKENEIKRVSDSEIDRSLIALYEKNFAPAAAAQ